MAKIHTFAGNDFYIYNADKYLDFKMAKFMSAYSGLYDLVGKQVSSSDTRLWTEEMLTQAFVKIDNYYRVTDEKNPVYANIFPKNAWKLTKILKFKVTLLYLFDKVAFFI